MKGNLLGPDIEARQIQTTQKPLFDPTAITPEQYKLNHNYFTLQELLQQPNYSLTQQLNLLYFGAVQNGVKHGLGVLVTPHSLYEGEFSLDRKMGKGYAVLPNGSQYHGDFANDRPHGRGLLTHGEEYYMGDFQNGAMEGEGLWRNAQGQKYVGQWKNNRAHGQGIHSSPHSNYQGRKTSNQAVSTNS